MNDHKSLWETDLFHFSRDEALIAPALRAWMSNSQSKLGRYIEEIEYTSEFIEFSKSDVHDFERLILKASGSKAAALPPLRLLEKIVYHLNRVMQLSIPQPTLAIHMTPPKNPFAFADSVLAHRSVAEGLKAEEMWLHDLRLCPSFKSSGGNNVPFELVLFSAALHCGLLSSDLALGLHAAVMSPEQHVRYSAERVYLDLSLAWQGQPNQEIRRWYPDDGVACLIARLVEPEFGTTSVVGDESTVPYTDRRGRFCESIYKRLMTELKKRGVEPLLLPTSLSDLFGRIALFLRSEIPSCLVGFATRTLDTRSLLTPSIDRIYGDPALYVPGSDESEKECLADTQNADAYFGDNPTDTEPMWLECIRESFHASTRKTIEERFGLLNVESPVAKQIISFAKRLLRRGSSSGNSLALSSVKCCVLTVGRRLGGLLEERDPAAIAPETLEDLYVRAIDDAAKDSIDPLHLQATVSWALREFHRHLVRERVAKPLNETNVFRVARGLLTVDATIVSVEDVFDTFKYLHLSQIHLGRMKTETLQKWKFCLDFSQDFAQWRVWERAATIFPEVVCCRYWFFQRLNVD